MNKFDLQKVKNGQEIYSKVGEKPVSFHLWDDETVLRTGFIITVIWNKEAVRTYDNKGAEKYLFIL